MTIDLITGFLGAGKTTFIRSYAKYFINKGNRICILENDYGAVNVDVMFLQDLLGDQCELEMVIGGDGYEAHRRRFKTKLISMAMTGYDRVLVEPSGVFDVDEFFDVLREEPLDRWYTPGNVISIVSVKQEKSLSSDARYLLASQIANAGCVVLSKAQEADEREISDTVSLMNEVMNEFHCGRRFGDDVISGNWETFDDSDYEKISKCGYRLENHVKYQVEQENGYRSLFYFYIKMQEAEIRETADHIFCDPVFGNVHRIKGFVETDNGHWLLVNAVPGKIEIEERDRGQNALIVIGENLNRGLIDKCFVHRAKYHGEL
ncbi:MAG: GTP-binding protein [Lachnospiraceae bacterium]|nr:GTP-binding protein [Lachnospiraceae bacterium]